MRYPLRDALADNQLFRGLPDRIIDRLFAVAVRRTYLKGERIFSQGDEGDALYCVVSGRVRIVAVGGTSQEVFLNIIEPHESFGEIAVIDGLPRTATAVAIEPVKLIALGRNDLIEVLGAEPELALHLLRLFCQRMRWASDLVEESAFLSPPARLAKRLLSLAMLHGKATEDGIALSISQIELAKFLGASRQYVNEKLQAWKTRGWVSLARRSLLIVDPAALKRIAGDGLPGSGQAAPAKDA